MSVVELRQNGLEPDRLQPLMYGKILNYIKKISLNIYESNWRFFIWILGIILIIFYGGFLFGFYGFGHWQLSDWPILAIFIIALCLRLFIPPWTIHDLSIYTPVHSAQLHKFFPRLLHPGTDLLNLFSCQLLEFWILIGFYLMPLLALLPCFPFIYSCVI